MEDAAEDAGKMGASTTIGKLLKEIVDQVRNRHADSIADALADVALKLSADSEDKDEDLKALDGDIAAELKNIFPGITAKTHIPIPEFPEFIKGATVKIFEPSYDVEHGRDVRALGHGAQRAVQISLIKCLANRKNQAGGDAARTTLILLDEPELYLHPQAVETIRDALVQLSQQGYQVIFTTHSANMIARQDAANVSLVRRKSDKGTYCIPTLAQAVKNAILEAEHQSVTLFELTNSSKFLFSEVVLLVEGKTEKILLPRIYELEFARRIEADRIALIDVGSANSLTSTMMVLEKMGIPNLAAADLDFAFRGAVSAGMIEDNSPDINACKAIFQRLEKEGKLELHGGLPRNQKGGPTAAEGFEKLAECSDATPHIKNLKNQLQKNNVWLWPLGAIEKQLGLQSKNSSEEYVRFMKQIAHEEYRAALVGYEEVKAMLNRLKQLA